jgi:CheY-like chemotaxis protein
VKALIVDDEPTVRLLLSRILRREVDCAVTEATNGIEALDFLGRQHFDFVVIDVMMPLMDGIETLEAIRSTPELANLPVLVLSAVRDEAQVRQLVALGVSAYLTKPLRPSDASFRIRRFVASLGASTHAPQQGQGRTVLGLSDNARMLVVDGDADFRHFVRSTLGQQYTITEAESGAQGLRACLEASPEVVLLGQSLGALPPAMFLRKLRSLPGLATVPVVLVGASGADASAGDADAVIQRTFVPEAFRKQFARLVTGGSVEQRVLVSRPELRPQMISATEEVLGMMLGLEVFADATEPQAPVAVVDMARVRIELPHEDGDLEFGIITAREMSERMTAMSRRGADVVSDEHASSTLQEIASIISGRLQNALRSRGDEVGIGVPTVERLAPDASIAAGWAAVGFSSASGEVRFVSFIRPLAKRAATDALEHLEAAP